MNSMCPNMVICQIVIENDETNWILSLAKYPKNPKGEYGVKYLQSTNSYAVIWDFVNI